MTIFASSPIILRCTILRLFASCHFCHQIFLIRGMTSLIIYGGTVLLPEGKQLPNAVVVCKNNHIHEILQNDDQLLLVESVKHFLLQPKSSEKEGTDRIFSISDSEGMWLKMFASSLHLHLLRFWPPPQCFTMQVVFLSVPA